MTNDAYMLTAIGLALLGIFLSPTLIAFVKGHKYRWIILFINVVFGLTLIGWFGAFVWALAGDDLI
jgi:H+/Cl- antiporter ClcA